MSEPRPVLWWVLALRLGHSNWQSLFDRERSARAIVEAFRRLHG